MSLLKEKEAKFQKNSSNTRNSKFKKSEVQWGSEYLPFEYRKHLNTKLFEVQISNGRSMGYVQCNKPTF